MSRTPETPGFASSVSREDVPEPVDLLGGKAGPADLRALLAAVAGSVGDVPQLLALARSAGKTLPLPGPQSPASNSTAAVWTVLASIAAVDVAAARIFEPHLDALAILDQAGIPDSGGRTWGVFAAEGPGLRLEAIATTLAAQDNHVRGPEEGPQWLLDGSKPWCSLASALDGALVTAHTPDAGRALFAISLKDGTVEAEEPDWIAHGLREVPSGSIHCAGTPAVPVGNPGWYHARPGFAWGGMAVAACWLGGAVAVARDFSRSLNHQADGGRQPDQLALAALGEMDRTLTMTLRWLGATAQAVDAGELDGADAWPEALRVRATVAAAVERVLDLAARNRGPAPLAFDRTYAKRMADLSLYVRQHHGSRDDAQLARFTLQGKRSW